MQVYKTKSSTLQFFQHIKPHTIKMYEANSQDLSTVMTVMSANIEGLTASKVSMLSEMCKREHCHCLCLQETHRAPHLARPNITGMPFIAERPHIVVVVVRLRSWFVSVWVSRLEIAEFPDGVHWSAPLN